MRIPIRFKYFPEMLTILIWFAGSYLLIINNQPNGRFINTLFARIVLFPGYALYMFFSGFISGKDSEIMIVLLSAGVLLYAGILFLIVSWIRIGLKK